MESILFTAVEFRKQRVCRFLHVHRVFIKIYKDHQVLKTCLPPAIQISDVIAREVYGHIFKPGPIELDLFVSKITKKSNFEDICNLKGKIIKEACFVIMLCGTQEQKLWS